jgi:hypothetical protein
MKRMNHLFCTFMISVSLSGMLVISADAKSGYKRPKKTDTTVSQTLDNSWDGDLDSNWGYDYSLNPNEFGQNLYGPYGDFGYGGLGYGYETW